MCSLTKFACRSFLLRCQCAFCWRLHNTFLCFLVGVQRRNCKTCTRIWETGYPDVVGGDAGRKSLYLPLWYWQSDQGQTWQSRSPLHEDTTRYVHMLLGWLLVKNSRMRWIGLAFKWWAAHSDRLYLQTFFVVCLPILRNPVKAYEIIHCCLCPPNLAFELVAQFWRNWSH